MIDTRQMVSVRSYPQRHSSGSAERWWVAAAFFITALFFVLSLIISTRRMFWFDEVYTTLSTRLPTWTGMWHAVTGAADPAPFGFFAIARISDHLLGPGELGIRIPSAVAAAIGLIITYLCARRLTGSFHAVLSIALLFCSFLPFYASEGRPYGIYFLCSALAIWCWLRRSAWAIGPVFFAGTFIHYYMVFCLVPFAVAEALHWRPWKWPSRHFIAASAGALLLVITQLPQLTANRHFYGRSFWAAPDLQTLRSVYDDIFPHMTFWLALILVCCAVFAAGKSELRRMSEGERVCWLFALIPLVGFVSAVLVTNAFTARYFISILPGIAVAFACMIGRIFDDRRGMSALICAILLLFGGSKIVLQARHPDRIELPFGAYQAQVRDVLAREERIWNDGKKYTVMPLLLVLPARYYSHRPERYLRWTPDPPPSDAIVPAWSADVVIEHAREIAFINPEWELLERLRKANVRLEVKKAGSVTLVYAE